MSLNEQLPASDAKAAPDTSMPRDDQVDPSELLLPLLRHWKLVLLGPILIGAAALGATYLIKPVYTARMLFLPPQQQQSAAATALASLGSLASLAGAGAGLRNPIDQYLTLLQTAAVADKLIERFKLMDVYEADLRFDAYRTLRENVRVTAGKRDGIITVEVDDTDPRRAADMANQHAEELRALTSALALTEAQQRRAFFEQQLAKAREELKTTQLALQRSGFTQGALRAEPRAAAESYAKLKAESTAADIRLQALRSGLAESTPEVQRQLTIVTAMRSQLANAEASLPDSGDPGYISAYRDFKYRETLFELFSRQYEAARVDESRESALIQVVDRATPPERKSRPKRALTALTAALLSFLALSITVIARDRWRRGAADPATVARRRRYANAWTGRA